MMEPGLHIEWNELCDGIWHRLRQKSHINHDRHYSLAQLLVIPSFGDTWCIDLLDSEGVFTAYLTIWKSSQDVLAFESGLARLRHPRPFISSIESIKLPVSEKTVENVLTQLNRLSVSVLEPEKGISIDGTGYELQTESESCKWHNHIPNAWPQEFKVAVQSLMALGRTRG